MGMPEFRSCGLGRLLMGAGLIAGKPKDVRLQVAGSDGNKAAVGLYSSLGFQWADDAPEHTEMVLSAEQAERAVSTVAARLVPPVSAPHVATLVGVAKGKAVLQLTVCNKNV